MDRRYLPSPRHERLQLHIAYRTHRNHNICNYREKSSPKLHSIKYY